MLIVRKANIKSLIKRLLTQKPTFS